MVGEEGYPRQALKGLILRRRKPGWPSQSLAMFLLLVGTLFASLEGLSKIQQLGEKLGSGR